MTYEEQLEEQARRRRELIELLRKGSWSSIQKFHPSRLPDADTVFEILAERRPDWAGAFVEWLLDRGLGGWGYRLIRRLVHEGLCARPASESYHLALITAFDRHRMPEGTRLMDCLDADPGLLDDEVWRLFELDGDSEHSLATYDRWGPSEWKWAATLVELAAEGRLPRERLLDASLDALGRDFIQFRARWFSKFHDALAPTPEEKTARAERYLHLLACSAASTVSFALKHARAVDSKQPYAAEALADGLRLVLAVRPKSVVKPALKLLERAARRQAGAAPVVTMAFVEALSHDNDVQELALAWLERADVDGEAAAALGDLSDVVAPSLRQRLAALIGAGDAPASEPDPATDGSALDGADLAELEARASRLDSGARRLAGLDVLLEAIREGRWETDVLDTVPLRFAATEIPRLDPAQAVAPVASLEELIDEAAFAIENPDEVDRVERSLCGISRLCGERPPEWRSWTDPLRRRARKLSASHSWQSFIHSAPDADFLGVVLAWLDAEAPPEVERTPGIREFLAWHFEEVARRVARGEARQLLCEPTHRGGWVDARALVERFAACDRRPSSPDLLLALLRLAPDGRDEALRRTRGWDGEVGQAIRYALGAEVEIGPTRSLWVTASRARSPDGADRALAARHTLAGPDVAEPAGYRPEVREEHVSHEYGDFWRTWLEVSPRPEMPAEVPADLPSLLLHTPGSGRRSVEWEYHAGVQGRGRVRWPATVWPAARESYFAWGAVEIADNLDWMEARWANKRFLEPLFDPDTPLSSLGALLIAAALAAKEPGEHGLAVDAAIETIQDGRLDAQSLGEALAFLLPTRLSKPGRWAKRLAEVAEAGPLAAWVVRRGLEAALGADPDLDPKRLPRDFAALLGLYHELLVAAGEEAAGAGARAFLGRYRGSTKAAKIARQVLAREAVPDPARRRGVLVEALAGRVERVERWHGRLGRVAGQKA